MEGQGDALADWKLAELSNVGRVQATKVVAEVVCGYRSPVHPCGRWSAPSKFSLRPSSSFSPIPDTARELLSLILIPSSYTEFT